MTNMIESAEGRAVVPRCGDCIYFEHEDPKLKFGECRRYPPTFRLKGERVGFVSVYEAESAWPVLNKDQWCVGEFRPIRPKEGL